MKSFIYKASKASPKPEHVHSNMFILGNTYVITVKDPLDDFVEVSGTFGNRLGGTERKTNNIRKSICKEHLELVKVL
jgi:hypothetical protein